MLIAITRNPLSDSISRMVNTVSYSTEFPTFFEESVLVATYKPESAMSRGIGDCFHTCARISFMASLASGSPCPR